MRRRLLRWLAARLGVRVDRVTIVVFEGEALDAIDRGEMVPVVTMAKIVRFDEAFLYTQRGPPEVV